MLFMFRHQTAPGAGERCAHMLETVFVSQGGSPHTQGSLEEQAWVELLGDEKTFVRYLDTAWYFPKFAAILFQPSARK